MQHGILEFSADIRVFENNDPLSIPSQAYTVTSTPGEFYGGFGFILPNNLWADIEGLIEIELTQGQLANISASVSAESNGSVYTSASMA